MADKLQYTTEVDRKIDLSFSRACEFLEMDTFEGERQVNESHVQELWKAHCNGEFIWEHVEIGVCKVDSIPEKLFRVNGQHTSWLRINLGEKYSERCMVREVQYRVPDEHMLRRLYCTFDQNKARTQAHSFKALVTGSRMSVDVPASQLSKLSAGLKLFLNEEGSLGFQNSRAGDLAAIALDKYPSLFATVGIFRRPGNIATYIPGQRAAVVAAMFATFNASVEKSNEFWTPICTGLGLSVQTDPRHQLKKFLESHSHSNKGNSAGKIVVSAEDMYRVCINAWNHWRKGNAITRLQATDRRLKAV